MVHNIWTRTIFGILWIEWDVYRVTMRQEQEIKRKTKQNKTNEVVKCFSWRMRQIKFHCISTWESSNGFYTQFFFLYIYIPRALSLWKRLKTLKCCPFLHYNRTRTRTFTQTFSASFKRTFSIANWTYSISNFAHKKQQNNEFSITLFCECVCVYVHACVELFKLFARDFCVSCIHLALISLSFSLPADKIYWNNMLSYTFII